MELLDDYVKLVEDSKWDEALPLIEHIISLNPNLGTSWFNYGVCLDALTRHNEASQAFLRAYQIDEEDYGAQYRVFRSLALAENGATFKDFLSKEILKVPDVAELLSEDMIFNKMLARTDVQSIIRNATFRF